MVTNHHTQLSTHIRSKKERRSHKLRLSPYLTIVYYLFQQLIVFTKNSMNISLQTIAAIIVSFESGDVLPACLDALKAEGVAAIVVDNASTDDSCERAQAHDARVIRNAKNQGFGRGMNIGVDAASGFEYVLLLNPDAMLEKGSIAALIEAAKRYPNAGILSPRILSPDGSIFFPTKSLAAPYLQNEKRVRVVPTGDCSAPFLSGACYLIRRDLFLQIGGFDPHIFLFYEDNDLCRRVIDAGYSVTYVHDAVVSHAQGKSSKPVAGRRFKTRWHYAWSEGYMAHKYGLPDLSLKTFLRNGLKYLVALPTRNAQKLERYGGSAAGALAFLRGKTALDREGLE
jgi:N-acetylglucosaminyl-diphospho-decaprenol L-rhamnosyltransferase